MAPRDAYSDEASLTAHLDRLLTTATETDAAIASASYTDVTITASNLHNGISLTNDLLKLANVCDPLPPLSRTVPCEGVLAAALTALIRLARCTAANHNLRQEAERASRDATARADRLARAVQEVEARLKKRDAQLAANRNATEEATVRARREARRVAGNETQLRARLAKAAHREDHLVLEARKREREFSALQTRVHALVKTADKLSIEPRITLAGTRKIKLGKVDDVRKDSGGVEDPNRARVVALDEENDELRAILRAVQEELDDLLEHHGHLIRDDGSDLSENASLDFQPAPTAEQMRLPLEMVRDDLQNSLEHKFELVRRALEHAEGQQTEKSGNEVHRDDGTP